MDPCSSLNAFPNIKRKKKHLEIKLRMSNVRIHVHSAHLAKKYLALIQECPSSPDLDNFSLFLLLIYLFCCH